MRLLKSVTSLLAGLWLVVVLAAAIGEDDSTARKSSKKGHPYGVATAYCEDGLTSSGTHTGPRVAASTFLKAGTKVRLIGKQAFIGGRRLFRIEDTGNLAGNQLDLWTGSCQAARDWGVRKIHYKIGWSAP